MEALMGCLFVETQKKEEETGLESGKETYVIEQPIPPSHAAGSTHQAFVGWNAIYDAYNEVTCLMLGSMTPELHRQFENSSPYDIIQELRSMFEKQSGVESVGLILNGLTSDFVRFVRNYNMHNMGKTIGELHDLLIEYEKGLPKKVATNQVLAIQEHQAKDDACHHCKVVGNWKMNCHVYLAELIRRISKLALAVLQRFTDYGISVSKNDVLYFNVIPRDGIYEIDMLKLIPNVNSIYNVINKRAKHNLDSTYLWHGHLALISKKRIEKLQHDGLLKSTDDESFDQCVSCLSDMYQDKWEGELKENQDEDTSPSENTSEVPAEVEGFKPPQEDKAHVRRSVRTHQAPKRLYLNVEVEEQNLGDLNKPASYKATLLYLKSNKWLDAMNAKMQSMKNNQTNIDGNVHTYKARLVAKGYTQTYGVDYEETFSPITGTRAIRIRIAITVFYDYEIWHIDVKSAFLNGYLDEDIYTVQPEGFVDPKHYKKVSKLQRSIYRLKQASKGWNKRFDEEIKKFGFAQNLDEPCVYQKASGSNVTFLILYVDDIIIMGNHISMLQSVKTYLGKCFAMKDLGDLAFILAIKICRARSKRLIILSQSAYTDKILIRFRMNISKRGNIPMQEILDLNKKQGASTPEEVKRMQNVPYASTVRSIMYAVKCTRPVLHSRKT
nr:retrotransposon protein, putative, Ty1-copia subclass [Tanacetum cinerariifolium]